MRKQKFSKHMLVHYFLAAGASGAVFFLTKSFLWAELAFLINIFLDADHLLDYWLANGFDLNYKKFINETVGGDEPGIYFRKSQKVVVLFHSWELALLTIVAAWIVNLPQLAIAFAFGFLPHLLWDQLTYAKNPLMYFFVFRAFRRFNLKEVCSV